MNIAYILGPHAILSGDSNGIKSQARAWESCLKTLGHNIEEVSPWGNYPWNKFDLIHIFGAGLWLPSLVKILSKKNPNIVLSPIIDSIKIPFAYKLSGYLGSEKLRLYSPTYALKKSLPYLKGIFMRSDFEASYFNYSMGPHLNKTFKVPISFGAPVLDNIYEKEMFCLHVSSIYQERKNVRRLIQASKKYNFQLILVGSKGSENDFLPIQKEVGNSENIKVLGFVPNERLAELYKRAKVFALPSIREGVGIVALDAAMYGCEIVITKFGGPKEYYDGMALEVDPYSVDEIGTAVLRLLSDEKKFQPALKKHIVKNYSIEMISDQLELAYRKILTPNA